MRLGPLATARLLEIFEQNNRSAKRTARLYVAQQGPRYPLTQEDIYYILRDTLNELDLVAKRLLR